MNPPLPILAITQGDPAGIGPELCLRAAAAPEVRARCRPVLVGDLSVLRHVGARLGLPVPQVVLTRAEELAGADGAAAAVLDCRCIAAAADIVPGQATRLAGEASLAYIGLAARAAQAGHVAGLVTAPITKTTLHLAGCTEPGHTEILARLTGVDDYAMMLYSARLAVTLVTIHQSLASVPGALRSSEIVRVTRLAAAALRRIRGRAPRLAVLGLNPHAGEQGLFGSEEARVIAPAVAVCRAEGLDVEGPLPPDAAFMPHALERYDGHIVMYHDQGLIPFKMISLHDGVNVTLGLPIVRTSVDHGTAYNIAWRGEANPSSLISAIELAVKLAGGGPGLRRSPS